MALTLSIVSKQVDDSGYITTADITGVNPYVAGGIALTDAQLNQLLPNCGGSLTVANDAGRISFFQSERDTSGRMLAYNRSNGKVLFFLAGAEAGAIDLSAVTIRARIRYGQVNLG